MMDHDSSRRRKLTGDSTKQWCCDAEGACDMTPAFTILWQYFSSAMTMQWKCFDSVITTVELCYDISLLVLVQSKLFC